MWTSVPEPLEQFLIYIVINIFLILGDFFHVISFFILFIKVFKTRSTRGISCKMFILFVLVFITRYLDLPMYIISVYNTVMKVLFITMSCVMVYLIHIKFSQVKDAGAADNFRVERLIIPALVLALFVNHRISFLEVLWSFSIFLEAVAILPQLTLVQNTGEVDAYTCYSVATLAAYRGFYVVNWVYRYSHENRMDDIAFFAGLIQTLLYSFTAGYMILQYRKETQTSKLSLIDSLKQDIIFKDNEAESILQEKNAFSDYPVTLQNTEIMNHLGPFDVNQVKVHSCVPKDGYQPQVCLQEKKEEQFVHHI
ncbi:ER lumen protein-retaining receptor-like [Bacillus rossius redtenbacheri]|uniref:ER lumen protein-retaining receptor-like n=1 Tax=Bacillus rossius redtenbacheri TaxID=93214 RepID=UPI002FDD8D28